MHLIIGLQTTDKMGQHIATNIFGDLSAQFIGFLFFLRLWRDYIAELKYNPCPCLFAASIAESSASKCERLIDHGGRQPGVLFAAFQRF